MAVAERVAGEGSRYQAEGTFDIGAVEQQLQLLWKDAAEESTRSGEGAVTRACSMTLVAPCSNDEQFDHVRAVVENASLRHPGRAILGRIDVHGTESRLEAQVSAVCTMGGADQKRVCHEQVILSASGDGLRVVAPAFVSLLVPDVPAYLWVPCEKLLAHELVTQVAIAADALLVDARRFSDPFGGLALCARIARDHRATRAAEEGHGGSGFGIHDLEWIRMAPWFDAVACAFDGADARRLAQGIQTLRIDYAAPASPDADRRARSQGGREILSAAYLAGWFASRLGWRLSGKRPESKASRTEMELASTDGVRRITLVARSENDAPGTLLEVEAASSGGRVRLERDAGADRIRARVGIGGTSPPIRDLRVPRLEDGLALSAALVRVPRDAGYEAALPISLALAPR